MFSLDVARRILYYIVPTVERTVEAVAASLSAILNSGILGLAPR